MRVLYTTIENYLYYNLYVMSIIAKKANPAEIDTPATWKVSLYVDCNDWKIKIKDDSWCVNELAYAWTQQCIMNVDVLVVWWGWGWWYTYKNWWYYYSNAWWGWWWTCESYWYQLLNDCVNVIVWVWWVCCWEVWWTSCFWDLCAVWWNSWWSWKSWNWFSAWWSNCGTVTAGWWWWAWWQWWYAIYHSRDWWVEWDWWPWYTSCISWTLYSYWCWWWWSGWQKRWCLRPWSAWAWNNWNIDACIYWWAGWWIWDWPSWTPWKWYQWVVIVRYKTDWSMGVKCATGWDITCCDWYTIHTFTDTTQPQVFCVTCSTPFYPVV